jgi:hypothetical protein
MLEHLDSPHAISFTYRDYLACETRAALVNIWHRKCMSACIIAASFKIIQVHFHMHEVYTTQSALAFPHLDVHAPPCKDTWHPNK